MSTLEGYAKKVLTPLMTDISFSLDSVQQWLLSIWAVKTAMVFETTDRTRTWFYTQDERKELLEFKQASRWNCGVDWSPRAKQCRGWNRHLLTCAGITTNRSRKATSQAFFFFD